MVTNSNKGFQLESAILYIITCLMVPFAVYNYLNVYVWNISFNPVDYILKPFLIVHAASPLLALLTEWGMNAFLHVKKLSVKIKKGNGRISFKLVTKSLPIHIIDQGYLKEFQIKGKTVVDMRIKDHNKLTLGDHVDVVKLYDHDDQVTIPYLIEKANLLIRTTALKEKPITFIVDSKKEKNRTISKIWLRLILNPKSNSAMADIHTIVELVY